MKRGLLVIGLVLLAVLGAVYATTSVFSPTACAGQWTSCANANADDANRATAVATNTANFSGIWRNYSFSISDSAAINSVVVRADFFASNVRGFAKVRVSGDGGATYGPIHTIGGNTAEQSYFIDVTSDLAWTGSKLNNANLRVNATCFKSPQSSTNPTCRLDWIPVNVTYTDFDYSLSVSPTGGSVSQGNTALTTSTVTLLGGTSQTVTLSSTGCPPSATCSFNVGSGSPTFKSNLTVATDVTTPTGTYPINVTASGDGLVRWTTYTLNVTA